MWISVELQQSPEDAAEFWAIVSEEHNSLDVVWGSTWDQVKQALPDQCQEMSLVDRIDSETEDGEAFVGWVIHA